MRFTGNLIVAAFFAEDSDKKRQQRRDGRNDPDSDNYQVGRQFLAICQSHRADAIVATAWSRASTAYSSPFVRRASQYM